MVGDADERLVSLLHAQLVRVHQRLSRTETRLRDERGARLALEREVQSLHAELRAPRPERDDGDRSPASPTRRLVEDAVDKAARARSEAEELRARLAAAETAAAEGRAALVERESLRRALTNLNCSFEEQERRMRSSLASADAELAELGAEKARYEALTEKMYRVCEEFHGLAYGGPSPEHPDGAGDDRRPTHAPIPEEDEDDDDSSPASLDAHVDGGGSIEPCEWDGGGDDISSETSSPPPSPTRC